MKFIFATVFVGFIHINYFEVNNNHFEANK